MTRFPMLPAAPRAAMRRGLAAAPGGARRRRRAAAGARDGVAAPGGRHRPPDGPGARRPPRAAARVGRRAAAERARPAPEARRTPGRPANDVAGTGSQASAGRVSGPVPWRAPPPVARTRVRRGIGTARPAAGVRRRLSGTAPPTCDSQGVDCRGRRLDVDWDVRERPRRIGHVRVRVELPHDALSPAQLDGLRASVVDCLLHKPLVHPPELVVDMVPPTSAGIAPAAAFACDSGACCRPLR